MSELRVGAVFGLVRMLHDRRPTIEQLRSEYLLKGRAELPRHCAVQDEIDGRVGQSQDVH